MQKLAGIEVRLFGRGTHVAPFLSIYWRVLRATRASIDLAEDFRIWNA